MRKKNEIRKTSRRPSKLSKKEIQTCISKILKRAESETDAFLRTKQALQARKIQMKTRSKFPSKWKNRFCKNCKTFLYPGDNCHVRLNASKKTIIITCHNCKAKSRIPYY